MKADRNSEQYDCGQDLRRQVRVLNVGELLKGAREIRIRHADEEYRLRLTRKNRLILTK